MKKTIFALLYSLTFCFGQRDNDQPLNVILLIGDGMGLSQISAGMYFNNNQTVLEEFPHVGLSKTHSANNLVTDSAASGTAMACGEKTLNGVIGINSQNQKLKSILEICKEKGYNTGLIATSSIVHATPASFYAKIHSRKKYEDIALQLSQSEVDYFIGGGKNFFMKREDKRNLIKEMNEVEIVKNLNGFKKSTNDRIGLLTYPEEPPALKGGREPLLDAYLSATLEKMEQRQKPFFIMVEGSQIDWGGHANDIDYITSEFVEFNNTIAVALDFAKKNQNTLVVVTADHETGGLAITLGKIDPIEFRSDFNTTGHSATMVPVFGYGKKAEFFSGIYDNTQIFHKINKAVEGK